MDTSLDAVIVTAERLSDGLVVKFQDGRCAFYSAVLLSAIFADAEELDEAAVAW